jgi:hypothetical protein
MPLAVGYQVQLGVLRDEIIDLVAQRSRLEKRMEARLQGDDLDGLEQGLKEYVLLPQRDVFADRLNRMKEQAAIQQAKSKTPVLSRNVQARFTELQALIDRYLDNETFQTYTEALERKREERATDAKNKSSKGHRAQAAGSAPISEGSDKSTRSEESKTRPDASPVSPKATGPPF